MAEHGILQPVCVRPSGERHLLVYGLRRLKAAIRAGLEEVPCTIQVADDDRAFVLDTIENLHRHQLSGAERVRAQVAGLIGRGLKDREIAAALVLSEHTVHAHVRNVLAKLGLSSRAQIAAWVATHAPDGQGDV